SNKSSISTRRSSSSTASSSSDTATHQPSRISKDFPTPGNILHYVARLNHNNTTPNGNSSDRTHSNDDLEGSGELESPPELPLASKLVQTQSERKRRNPRAEDDGINIVDVDVSTPQLNIVDEQLDFPDISTPPSTSPIGTHRQPVCVPLAGVWALSGVSVVSVIAAIGAVYHVRLSRRKLLPLY
ncbi:unnamed protein product, partial [Anisakis simplex]|uniref:ZP domain-containing protein n=1 Tax=Anisakis simplex TaxID=6269 RepID=A0A0M3J2D2_ANISI